MQQPKKTSNKVKALIFGGFMAAGSLIGATAVDHALPDDIDIQVEREMHTVNDGDYLHDTSGWTVFTNSERKCSWNIARDMGGLVFQEDDAFKCEYGIYKHLEPGEAVSFEYKTTDELPREELNPQRVAIYDGHVIPENDFKPIDKIHWSNVPLSDDIMYSDGEWQRVMLGENDEKSTVVLYVKDSWINDWKNTNWIRDLQTTENSGEIFSNLPEVDIHQEYTKIPNYMIGGSLGAFAGFVPSLYMWISESDKQDAYNEFLRIERTKKEEEERQEAQRKAEEEKKKRELGSKITHYMGDKYTEDGTIEED